MTKRNRQKVQDRRNTKKEEKGRVIKDKFEDERIPKPIHPKTDKQKEYFRMLRDPNIQCIVVLGLHGTGKTFCASVVAADAYRTNEIEEIVVARPYVQTGRTSGFKPGNSFEKLYPYVRNVLDTIKSRIGDGAYFNALKDGQSGAIQVQEVESIRGRSFDRNGFLIIDEAQQTLPEEMKSVVTRISDSTKLVLCGDENQKDIKGESGLKWFLDFSNRHNLKGVGIINFNEPSDIVRGGFVKDVAIGLMKDGESR